MTSRHTRCLRLPACEWSVFERQGESRKTLHRKRSGFYRGRQSGKESRWIAIEGNGLGW